MARLTILALLALLLGCPPILNNPGGGAGAPAPATGAPPAAPPDHRDPGADDDATGDDDDDDIVDPPLLPIGAECTQNQDCISGVCWNFADYDPWCGGAVCSDRCEDTEYCVELAFEAGAGDPTGALCGEDGLCDFVGAGLGDFWCADGVE